MVPPADGHELVPASFLTSMSSLCVAISGLKPRSRHAARVLNGPNDTHESIGRMAEINVPDTQITDISCRADAPGELTVFWTGPSGVLVDVDCRARSTGAFHARTVAEGLEASCLKLTDMEPGRLVEVRVRCHKDVAASNSAPGKAAKGTGKSGEESPEIDEEYGAFVVGTAVDQIQSLRANEVSAQKAVVVWGKCLGASRYAVDVRAEGSDQWNRMMDDLEKEEAELLGLSGTIQVRVTPGQALSVCGEGLSAVITIDTSKYIAPSVVASAADEQANVTLHALGRSASVWINDPQKYGDVEAKIKSKLSKEVRERRRQLAASGSSPRVLTPRGQGFGSVRAHYEGDYEVEEKEDIAVVQKSLEEMSVLEKAKHERSITKSRMSYQQEKRVETHVLSSLHMGSYLGDLGRKKHQRAVRLSAIAYKEKHSNEGRERTASKMASLRSRAENLDLSKEGM